MDSGDVYSTSFFLYDSANSGALDSSVMFLLVNNAWSVSSIW